MRRMGHIIGAWGCFGICDGGLGSGKPCVTRGALGVAVTARFPRSPSRDSAGWLWLCGGEGILAAWSLPGRSPELLLVTSEPAVC